MLHFLSWKPHITKRNVCGPTRSTRREYLLSVSLRRCGGQPPRHLGVLQMLRQTKYDPWKFHQFVHLP